MSEQFSEKFEIKDYLATRLKTIDLCHTLAREIQPGMHEEDAHAIYKDLLLKNKIETSWHPTKIRFGKNTTKSFRDTSDSLILQNNDLFFLDIGPVINGYEGDYGETFCVGDFSPNLPQASRQIFETCKSYWQNSKCTGSDLYLFAVNESKKRNLTLNLKMSGHRLADFPHAIYHKNSLANWDKSASPYAWVLEIHVLDEKLGLGSFYEDILFQD